MDFLSPGFQLVLHPQCFEQSLEHRRHSLTNVEWCSLILASFYETEVQNLATCLIYSK